MDSNTKSFVTLVVVVLALCLCIGVVTPIIETANGVDLNTILTPPAMR